MVQCRSILKSVSLAAGLAAQLAVGVSLSSPPASGQELRSLFQQAKPSVVVIRTEEEAIEAIDEEAATRMKVRRTRTSANAVLELDDEGDEISESGLASGVLISNDGQILTAAHVVQTAEKVEVQFVDGSRQPAKIVSSVPYADVALIKVDRVPPSVHPA